jgi:dTDP-glucose pyrophosphorylase
MLEFADIALPVTAPIRLAVECINKSKAKLALVVSADNILVGTITDGDVRRGLLAGYSLDQPVTMVMARHPITVSPNATKDEVLSLMRNNKISQIPEVDKHGKVLSLKLAEELLNPDAFTNYFVIMAGGMGTRLHPLTENCPKPMLKIGGKPIVEHILEKARGDGFEHFVVTIGYLAEKVSDYLQDGRKWGVNIEYIEEDKPLGTAGSLSEMIAKTDQPFVVVNGDVLTGINFGDLLSYHVRASADATLAIYEHEYQLPYGVVETEKGKVISITEKPLRRTNVSAGIYVLSKAADNYLNHKVPIDMPTLMKKMLDDGRAIVPYPIYEPWIDIGRHDDLAAAARSF